MQMKKLIDIHMENLSTREAFLFRMDCGCCGRGYSTKPRSFSKAGSFPSTREKQILFDALYDQEQMQARCLAVQEAVAHFNYCPICKRLVCNYCFMICEDLDLCRDCADKLQEIGTPVLSEVLDAVV
jgi:hypothetical protein